MKCGHTANGENEKQYQFCVICSCGEKSSSYPSLENRKAKCSYGDSIVNSDYNLAFFKHKPDNEYDEYYCGCFGWD